MAWERRARGGSYYTRSVRSGGRIRREYLGTGPLAEAAADAAADRAEKRARRAQLRRQLDGLAEKVGAHSAVCESLAEAWLIAHGARKHNGEWRVPRRRKADDRDNAGDPADPAK